MKLDKVVKVASIVLLIQHAYQIRQTFANNGEMILELIIAAAVCVALSEPIACMSEPVYSLTFHLEASVKT